MNRFLLFLLLPLTGLSEIASAQVGAPTSNTSVSGTNPLTSNPFAARQENGPYISTSGVGAGATLTQNSTAAAYNASGWTAAATVDMEDYIYWTVHPANNGMNLGSVQFSIFRNEAGPQQYVLRSSLDNYTSDIGTGAIATTPANQMLTLQYPADLAIDPTVPVTFRLYAYGAHTGFGTVQVDNISFTGKSVAPLATGIYGFAVEGNEKDILVSWRTGQERTLSRYEIERSSDGANYEVIGTLPVQNQGMNTYTFHDLNPHRIKNFYRLVTVQMGGARTLSRTLVQNGSALPGADAPLQVMPNPVLGSEFAIQHPIATGKALLKITNTAGQEIYRNAVPVGSMITRIYNLNLENGSYYVAFEDGENRLSTVLVK